MPTPAKKVGRDLTEFRKSHDKNFIIPSKIEEAIKKLGPDSWEYEVPFMKLAEICTTDLALFREQFADFFVEIGGRNSKRVWCGSKAMATKLRSMV